MTATKTTTTTTTDWEVTAVRRSKRGGLSIEGVNHCYPAGHMNRRFFWTVDWYSFRDKQSCARYDFTGAEFADDGSREWLLRQYPEAFDGKEVA